MARRKRSTSRQAAKTRGRRKSPAKKDARLVNNLLGLIISLLMLLGLTSLGSLGTFIANCFRVLVGASYPLAIITVMLFSLSYTLYAQAPRFKLRWILGYLVTYAGLLLWLHVLMVSRQNVHANFIPVTWSNLSRVLFNGDSTVPIGGGMLGAYLYNGSDFLVSRVGTGILAWLLMVAGLVIFFALPWRQFLALTGRGIQQLGRGIRAMGQKVRDYADRPAVTATTSKSPAAAAPPEEEKPAAPAEPALPAQAATPPVVEAAQPQPAPKITVASSKQEDEPAPSDSPDTDLPMTGITAQEDKDYRLPPLDLLTKVPATDQQGDLKNIQRNTKTLQTTLQSFGVEATVENVNLGPSVTKYELRPAVGVKVSRITHLADDLALALAAKDIRIEAPIPGKSLIGIEVPNKQVATVGFRNMFEAAPADDHPLNVPLGRTVTGDVEMADLTKMPHLLIAGATGSGKSVAINVILTSILLKAKPHQVKLLLIDPKKVELSVYNGIPHLLSPVVSEPKKAARALGKVVAEMERRYELFAKFGVRNLAGYNKLVQDHNSQEESTDQPSLPLILVVVDELADLMMTVSNDVEDAIVRIAQMGRAAGIHMILATQRPSVDVITGLIKANVPSRIAFAVSSGIDSRTIIDTNGAEKLLGRGDMLFEPIDQNKPTRVQGAFISDHDVEAVVDYIKQEQPAEYDESMVVTDQEMAAEEEQEDEDELFPEALKFVAAEQKASTSLIQRRFRIGYNRAARIIDDLEQRGYIGPANGSKPREVFKQPDDEQQPPAE
ncbi:FtsK/SpoIIIE family DNA translocase [Limosilactobacillus antri]|uniref:FtsK/SpoIIIE family DNA translocase n=1 Tax=Limosilactobacillus antri TaxID=227943 RepID=UPI001F587A67|nr:DNA translocase FtsK [Limosilactobacillus antri]